MIPKIHMQAGRRDEKMPIMTLRRELSDGVGFRWAHHHRWLWDSFGFYFIELLLTFMTT
jgi:hypothetical protein